MPGKVEITTWDLPITVNMMMHVADNRKARNRNTRIEKNTC